MRRVPLVAMLMVLVLAGQSLAQTAGSLEDLHEKSSITAQDRQRIRAWVDVLVKAMLADTDPSRRAMAKARQSILAEGQGRTGRSQAFMQAFAEEAVASLAAAEPKAISQEARINLLMVVAAFRTVEGVPVLLKALEKDPYPASRYWGAKGLAMVAPVVVEKVVPRTEAEVADAAAKVIERETSAVTLLQLFETLGRFEHERAHDALADGLALVATRMSASDVIAARIFSGGIRSLEKAYAKEVRPDAKKRVLGAYATLCVWIMPPEEESRVVDSLMADLNASLEQLTGEKVGFVAGDSAQLRKLALLEWVEKLVRTKRIDKRPSMPPIIEETVGQVAGTSSGGANP